MNGDDLENTLGNVDEAIGIITLVTGTTEDGREFWAYLSVPPSKYQAFEEAQKSGQYILTEFGDILKHGSGSAPPPEAVREMADAYGIDPDLELHLEEIGNALKTLSQPE